MRVLVAGGGIAALEVLAGLRALAGERVTSNPGRSGDQFFLSAPCRRRCRSPCAGSVPGSSQAGPAGLGASFCPRRAHTGGREPRPSSSLPGGDFLAYDALVVAVGARTRRGESTARTWTRGPEGSSLFTRVLRDLESGAVRSVAFVIPRGVAWPIDAYALAFVARLAARARECRSERSILTAEATAPTGVRPRRWGGRCGTTTRAGIDLVTGVDVRESRRGRTMPPTRGSCCS